MLNVTAGASLQVFDSAAKVRDLCLQGGNSGLSGLSGVRKARDERAPSAYRFNDSSMLELSNRAVHSALCHAVLIHECAQRGDLLADLEFARADPLNQTCAHASRQGVRALLVAAHNATVPESPHCTTG